MKSLLIATGPGVAKDTEVCLDLERGGAPIFSPSDAFFIFLERISFRVAEIEGGLSCRLLIVVFFKINEEESACIIGHS